MGILCKLEKDNKILWAARHYADVILKSQTEVLGEVFDGKEMKKKPKLWEKQLQEEKVKSHREREREREVILGGDFMNKVFVEAKRKKENWELDARKLTVSKLIGFGGFGSVYKGIYEGKKVAVKVFGVRDEKRNSTEGRKKLMEEVFMQEVSIWCTLQHSNIAKFIGAIKKNNMSEIKMKCQKGAVLPVDGCCIVVEYVARGTLRSYLSKHTMKKKPSLDRLIQLALDIAKGLSYLHSEKIAHRDVKTENLLLDKSGRVKIIDFGISSEFFSLGLDYPPMMFGTTGTIGYMAPEVLSDPSYDHKCDVYSFAICLWEMYTCLDPYPEHISLSKISHQIYKDRRPDIPKSCPTALSDIMKKCWDVKPQNRPEMKEVVHMLEAIQTSTKGKQKLVFGFMPRKT